MPDASTIDLANVLQRLDEIECEIRDDNFGATLTEAQWLCQQLRTALADTRRVEHAMQNALVMSELLATAETLIAAQIDDEACELDHHGHCQTHGWTDGECWQPRAKAFLDAAMSGTPRENE